MSEAIGAISFAWDASQPAQVNQLFNGVEQQLGTPTVVIYNPSLRVKGYARSAPFAMGKFALRGLAQSIARKLAPQNIHVARFVIDGSIQSATRVELLTWQLKRRQSE